MTPLSWLYRLGGSVRRIVSRPAYRSDIPVICVGNIVVGGAGKTPTCLSLATLLQSRGMKVHFVSRGYGGSYKNARQVDPKSDSYEDVGDEPLLLAEVAPTWVARKRAEGIALASQEGPPDVIITDDGLQNPGFEKTLSLVVIDGGYGFGNERVLPAGPLRESIRQGMARADAALIIGEDQYNIGTLLMVRYGMPIIQGHFTLDGLPPDLGKDPVVAFAGIGRPQKFFESLEQEGLNLTARQAFADHYPYKVKDIERLDRIAKAHDAALLTTMKDFKRIPPEATKYVTPINASVLWEQQEELLTLIKDVC